MLYAKMPPHTKVYRSSSCQASRLTPHTSRTTASTSPRVQMYLLFIAPLGATNGTETPTAEGGGLDVLDHEAGVLEHGVALAQPAGQSGRTMAGHVLASEVDHVADDVRRQRQEVVAGAGPLIVVLRAVVIDHGAEPVIGLVQDLGAHLVQQRSHVRAVVPESGQYVAEISDADTGDSGGSGALLKELHRGVEHEPADALDDRREHLLDLALGDVLAAVFEMQGQQPGREVALLHVPMDRGHNHGPPHVQGLDLVGMKDALVGAVPGDEAAEHVLGLGAELGHVVHDHPEVHLQRVHELALVEGHAAVRGQVRVRHGRLHDGHQQAGQGGLPGPGLAAQHEDRRLEAKQGAYKPAEHQCSLVGGEAEAGAQVLQVLHGAGLVNGRVEVLVVVHREQDVGWVVRGMDSVLGDAVAMPGRVRPPVYGVTVRSYPAPVLDLGPRIDGAVEQTRTEDLHRLLLGDLAASMAIPQSLQVLDLEVVQPARAGHQEATVRGHDRVPDELFEGGCSLGGERGAEDVGEMTAQGGEVVGTSLGGEPERGQVHTADRDAVSLQGSLERSDPAHGLAPAVVVVPDQHARGGELGEPIGEAVAVLQQRRRGAAGHGDDQRVVVQLGATVDDVHGLLALAYNDVEAGPEGGIAVDRPGDRDVLPGEVGALGAKILAGVLVGLGVVPVPAQAVVADLAAGMAVGVDHIRLAEPVMMVRRPDLRAAPVPSTTGVFFCPRVEVEAVQLGALHLAQYLHDVVQGVDLAAAVAVVPALVGVVVGAGLGVVVEQAGVPDLLTGATAVVPLARLPAPAHRHERLPDCVVEASGLLGVEVF